MKSVFLPDDVYDRASQLAECERVSVDELVASFVSEGIGEWKKLQARAARGSLEDLRQVLAKVSDAPPSPEDRL